MFTDRDVEAAFTLTAALGLTRFFFSEVHLCYDDYENIEVYKKHFACPVKMGQAYTAMMVPSSCLARELAGNNERAMDACIKACRELLEEISSHGSLKSYVVDMLISTPGVFPSIEQVAENLSMSTRSLRRKLQQEHTSFQDLLKEVRLSLAEQYMKKKLSVEQIAELLGYSEATAFSRAFKGWTGKTPQDFRAEKN